MHSSFYKYINVFYLGKIDLTIRLLMNKENYFSLTRWKDGGQRDGTENSLSMLIYQNPLHQALTASLPSKKGI